MPDACVKCRVQSHSLSPGSLSHISTHCQASGQPHLPTNQLGTHTHTPPLQQIFNGCCCHPLSRTIPFVCRCLFLLRHGLSTPMLCYETHLFIRYFLQYLFINFSFTCFCWLECNTLWPRAPEEVKPKGRHPGLDKEMSSCAISGTCAILINRYV